MFRKISLLFLIALLYVSFISFGVVFSQDATNVRSEAKFATDNATCTPGQRYYNTTNNVERLCIATNTWANAGSSGNGITQLTSDVTAGPGSGSQPATLATTGVSAATYGDSTHVGQFTVDAKGRITAASNVAISGGGGGASAAYQLTDFACTRTSALVVTCTFSSSGSNFGNSSYVTSLTTSIVITLSGASTATFYVYWNPNSPSNIKVDSSIGNFTGVTCTTGCTTVNTSVSNYPSDVYPLARLTETSNAWDAFSSCIPTNSSGCIDDRAISHLTVTLPGTFLNSTVDSHGLKTINVDTSKLTNPAGTLIVSAAAALAQTAGSPVCDDGSGGVKDTSCNGTSTRRTCMIVVGADNGSVLATADIAPQGRQCFINAASTVIEITVAADAGTPAVVVAKNHAGTLTDLSASLATGSAGALACANGAGSGNGLDGATACTAALSATALAAGDWLETHTSASASTAHRMSIAVTYTTP